MYKILLAILLIGAMQLMAFDDYDMDGVEDKKDMCPNTPFSALVDKNGCSKKILKGFGSSVSTNLYSFDVIIGFNYSESNYDSLQQNDTYSGSLQVDYYYKNFSIQASTSYYDTQSVSYNDSGIDDSFLGAYYTLNAQKNLNIVFGLGAIIPTYDSDLNNNNTDYTTSINLSYMATKSINLFGGYNYVIINDDDVENVKYQNTNAYNIGIGFYPIQQLYISAAYNSSQSIYKDVKDIDTISAYGYYSFNKRWFGTLNYAYGLSDTATDHYFSLRVGYCF